MCDYKNDAGKAVETQAMIGGPARPHAKEMLAAALRRKNERANYLEVLMRVIPWGLLTPEEDEALWNFFSERW